MNDRRTGRREALWDREAIELVRSLMSLRTVREAIRFLRDLLTEDEIRMIVDRWRVARLLDSGTSYRDIEGQTGLSSRTIARISRWLSEGEGGYRLLLERRRKRGTAMRRMEINLTRRARRSGSSGGLPPVIGSLTSHRRHHPRGHSAR